MNNTVPVAAAIVIALGMSVFAAGAHAQQPPIIIGGQNKPHMPAYTEPHIEATNPTNKGPGVVSVFMGTWTMHCFKGLSPCTQAAKQVQSAYSGAPAGGYMGIGSSPLVRSTENADIVIECRLTYKDCATAEKRLEKSGIKLIPRPTS